MSRSVLISKDTVTSEIMFTIAIPTIFFFATQLKAGLDSCNRSLRKRLSEYFYVIANDSLNGFHLKLRELAKS